ncbi:hypothetical protein [Azospirillum sp. sgz301742]
MKLIQVLLRALSLLDNAGTSLSLTNIFAWAAIAALFVSLFLTPDPTSITASVVATLVAVANYAHKRSISSAAAQQADAKDQIRSEVQANVQEVLDGLAEWKAQVETKVKEVGQTAEVAAKLRPTIRR